MRAIEAAVTAPGVGGVVVSGAAGVGKSRIAREALSCASARGCDVRWVVGTTSAREVPLGAFAAWTPSDVTDPVHLLRALVQSLTQAASPVVVAVDDVHLLDDLSAFVVHQIVQRDAARVVLTVRDGETIPVGVQEIWSGGRLDRVDLQPLPLDDMTALVTAALGAPIDPDAAQRLWRATRGNVLYLRHIVDREVADGRLRVRDGAVRWTGDPVVPTVLVDLVESRIGELPAPVGDVMDVLAVAEPVALSALRRITDPAAIEDAETRGLIVLEPARDLIDVRLAHPLYGEIRRRRSPLTRLRRLRGLVATELAGSADGDEVPVVVRRGALSVDSDLPLDGALLKRAAQGAIWLADLALAARLAAAAVRAGAGVEAELLRAHALSWSGRADEADAVLAGVTATDLSADDRARVAFHRASNTLWGLGEPARARQFIDEVPPDPGGYVDAFRTVYWFAVDRPVEAWQASADHAVSDLPAVVGAEVAWARTAIAGDAGRTAEALAIAEAGDAVAGRSLDAPQMRFNIADARVSAQLLAGEVHEAVAVAEQVRAHAADLPGAARLVGTAIAGRAALGNGRLTTARKLLVEATAGLAASHPMGWGYRYQVTLATVLAMLGSTQEAAALLTALDGVRRPFRSLDYERSLARAWVAASQGAVSEAIDVVRSAAERASALGQFAVEVSCLQTAAQFGDRTTADRLAELERVVDGPRVAIAARFAAAVRDHAAAEMTAASHDFERIGDLVAAADAAAHAARVYRGDELRGSAFGSANRADELAARCGGVTTPALRLAREPVPLTARESEIVMLIGEGMSNRQVAERLTLSVRTVESHIYRAMSKTGTNTREDLAAVLPRRRA